jgi:hypothetical protein
VRSEIIRESEQILFAELVADFHHSDLTGFNCLVETMVGSRGQVPPTVAPVCGDRPTTCGAMKGYLPVRPLRGGFLGMLPSVARGASLGSGARIPLPDSNRRLVILRGSCRQVRSRLSPANRSRTIYDNRKSGHPLRNRWDKSWQRGSNSIRPGRQGCK